MTEAGQVHGMLFRAQAVSFVQAEVRPGMGPRGSLPSEAARRALGRSSTVLLQAIVSGFCRDFGVCTLVEPPASSCGDLLSILTPEMCPVSSHDDFRNISEIGRKHELQAPSCSPQRNLGMGPTCAVR